MKVTPQLLEFVQLLAKNARTSRELTADEQNRIQDRLDEEIDARRVHGGMTLDEYLSGQGEQ